MNEHNVPGEGNEKIQAEQFDVIAKARKVGADDLQAAAIILKKAVIDG